MYQAKAVDGIWRWKVKVLQLNDKQEKQGHNDMNKKLNSNNKHAKKLQKIQYIINLTLNK